MAGIKRKSTDPSGSQTKVKSKKIKVESQTGKRSTKHSDTQLAKTPKKSKPVDESDELVESDTSGDENGLYGFSAAKTSSSGSPDDDADADADDPESKPTPKKIKQEAKGKSGKKELTNGNHSGKDSASAEKKSSALAGLNAATSREAHAKQKALAKERKAAKPNAEAIEQLKHLWERLRQKTNVTKEEREDLIAKTLEIVAGRIKDFVFKHDSVRVMQSVLKYSTSMEQRRTIARELKGEFKLLTEGKFSKFLVARLLEKGDPEIRSMIISEFYGHVKRLIHHPEASWILDDTYRQVATTEQKTRLLREWYGPEFSIKGLGTDGPDTSDLSTILEQSPEKRKPIMDYLEGQINSLVQKKSIAFTMLHDAMLQYFLTCKPGSTESNDFLEHLRPDPTLKEGEEDPNINLLKNLAFTKPGSRLVSLALAHGTAKDRKVLLRPYKDQITDMAIDPNAHHVLLAALAVVDDTKLTSKSIFGELLPTGDSLPEKVLNITNDARARTVLLYPFASDSKWLMDEETRERLSELYAIRGLTSKKDPNIRQQEIARAIEPQLLTAVLARTGDFAAFSFGLQFMGEVLVGAPEVEPEKRKKALEEVATHAQQILDNGNHATSHGKNMLKMLVQGGKFDPKTKKVVPVEPSLGFADMFWGQIKSDLMSWATGQGSFVIVSLVEAEEFVKKEGVLSALRKGRKQLEAAAAAPAQPDVKRQKKGKGADKGHARGNAGARILLEKL
ncbi:ARM repeat-containing protein [Lentithecium fluviatile CBS 122367]|uniref:ARM repeat-containing protein n=1 Tax=Lentithecium fluviatile CBS 122367 TaxID=1168545 RepID=A0A6G1J8J7_9PLEO|nr:ARM repeat-containing protein [Lentithecium fluviatile CBS 122367]